MRSHARGLLRVAAVVSTPLTLTATLAIGSSLVPPVLADDIIAASKRGDIFAVRHYLGKSREAIAARDRFEYTPLHWAAVQGHWDVVETLVERGADVNALGWDGGTPLHMACHHDRPDMVRVLLDAGADLTIRNQWGRTPLHVAARRNCDLVAALLLSRGADPNATTKEGWTPLHVAHMAGHPRVQQVLARARHRPGPEGRRRQGPGRLRLRAPRRGERRPTGPRRLRRSVRTRTGRRLSGSGSTTDACTWRSSARTSCTRSVPTPSTAAASHGRSPSTATTQGRWTEWTWPFSAAPSTAHGCPSTATSARRSARSATSPRPPAPSPSTGCAAPTPGRTGC